MYRRKSMVILAAALTLAVVAPTANGDVWKFVDRHGVVHLSDRPMGPGSELLVRGKKRIKNRSASSKRTLRYLEANERRYAHLIDRGVKGGLGVMLDDVMAGLYALACLQILRHTFGIP